MSGLIDCIFAIPFLAIFGIAAAVGSVAVDIIASNTDDKQRKQRYSDEASKLAKPASKQTSSTQTQQNQANCVSQGQSSVRAETKQQTQNPSVETTNAKWDDIKPGQLPWPLVPPITHQTTPLPVQQPTPNAPAVPEEDHFEENLNRFIEAMRRYASHKQDIKPAQVPEAFAEVRQLLDSSILQDGCPPTDVDGCYIRLEELEKLHLTEPAVTAQALSIFKQQLHRMMQQAAETVLQREQQRQQIHEMRMGVVPVLVSIEETVPQLKSQATEMRRQFETQISSWDGRDITPLQQISKKAYKLFEDNIGLIMQEQLSKELQDVLTKMGYKVTSLPSQTGFAARNAIAVNEQTGVEFAFTDGGKFSSQMFTTNADAEFNPKEQEKVCQLMDNLLPELQKRLGTKQVKLQERSRRHYQQGAQLPVVHLPDETWNWLLSRGEVDSVIPEQQYRQNPQ